MLRAHVEVLLECVNESSEILKSWDLLMHDQKESEKSAIGFTINRLQQRLKFKMKDFNFEDKKY